MISPFFHRDGVTIYHGDCGDVLRSLPGGCVHTCVTSPPYWGLRDYGVQGQLGAEAVHDCLGWATKAACGRCFVCRLVGILREVRRVLREDGTLWLNLGDSYASAWPCPRRNRIGNGPLPDGRRGDFRPSRLPAGLKEKDLVGVPWRVALALQADGWYLRSDVVWHKPNPMPDSAGDRLTCAHEYLFLLSKSPRYYFDQEAIKEPCESGPSDRKKMREGRDRIGGKHKLLEDPHSKANRTSRIGRWRAVGSPAGRNKRSVWTIATQPYAGAHFAVFPPGLIKPCILAGTSAEGCCPRCGAPYRRVVERRRVATRPGRETKTEGREMAVIGNRDPQRHVTSTRTVGWKPGCD